MYRYFSKLSSYLPVIIISIGVILRLLEYLYNRSLWLDEAKLAVNIVYKSFWQLTQSLDPVQYAPIGFLWLERLAVVAFGPDEYSLRLFPLIVSLISLPLFYKVTSYFLSKKAALISLILYVFSDSLIYYSVEVKQYTFDIFVSLLIYAVILKFIKDHHLTLKRIVILALVGILASWFSHPAVFILASLGLVLLLSAKKKWRLLVGIEVCWLLSFAINYFISTKVASESAELLNFWKDFFAPFPPTNVSELYWYFKSIVNFIYAPPYLSFPWIVILFFLFGCYSIYKGNKKNLLILTLPILFTLLASSLHKYPFVGRFLLFLVPITLIIIACGIEALINWSKKILGLRLSLSLGLTIIILLSYSSLSSDIFHLVSGRGEEEVKPILQYFLAHKKNEDVLYVYYAAIPALQFYEAKYGLTGSHYITGVSSRDKLSGYIIDLNKLKQYKRVWLMFSHVIPVPSQTESEEQFFVDYLDGLGKRLDSFQARGASIYLYQIL